MAPVRQVTRHRYRDTGFTLVELMVAIAILGLFMTVAMGSLRIASRSTAAGIDRADTTEEMRAVSEFLRQQLAHAPKLTSRDGGQDRIVFSGASRELRFAAPAPQFADDAGLVTYILAAENIEGIHYLTLAIAPFDPSTGDIDAFQPDERRIISTGFETIVFAYYGAVKARGRPEWKSAWPGDAEYLPAAVRVETRRENGSGGWPPLVLELRSGAGK